MTGVQTCALPISKLIFSKWKWGGMGGGSEMGGGSGMGGGSRSVSWTGRGLGVVQGLVLSRTYCTFTVPLATVWCIYIFDFKFKISWIIDE